jgi:hypothetical protein
MTSTMYRYRVLEITTDGWAAEASIRDIRGVAAADLDAAKAAARDGDAAEVIAADGTIYQITAIDRDGYPVGG